MTFTKPTNEQLANRFTYHAPFGDQALRYERIRAEILRAAKVIVELTPCCPEQARSLNALDEVMFLANAAIARNEKQSPPNPVEGSPAASPAKPVASDDIAPLEEKWCTCGHLKTVHGKFGCSTPGCNCLIPKD